MGSIFSQIMTIWDKKIISGAIEIQKKKTGVTTHFSEITVLQNRKKKKAE